MLQQSQSTETGAEMRNTTPSCYRIDARSQKHCCTDNIHIFIDIILFLLTEIQTIDTT